MKLVLYVSQLRKLCYRNHLLLQLSVRTLTTSLRIFSPGKETDTLRRNRLSPELMEALQILKYYYKQELLCFSSQLLAHEEDYTIEGPVTEAAVDELLKTGQIHVLEDLLRNSRESEASTLYHTSSVFD